MGILSKILRKDDFQSENKSDGKARDTTKKIIEGGCGNETPPRRPTARCEKCQPPYGRHFWLDSYGEWRCTQCHPPAAAAMVRDQVLVADVDHGTQGGRQDDVVPLGPGGEFVAGDEYPVNARGRWQYYEDRVGRHWERLTFA